MVLPANSLSTDAKDEFSVDFFPYGLFPFHSIRERGVCQWRGSKETVWRLVDEGVIGAAQRGHLWSL